MSPWRCTTADQPQQVGGIQDIDCDNYFVGPCVAFLLLAPNGTKRCPLQCRLSGRPADSFCSM